MTSPSDTEETSSRILLVDKPVSANILLSRQAMPKTSMEKMAPRKDLALTSALVQTDMPSTKEDFSTEADTSTSNIKVKYLDRLL